VFSRSEGAWSQQQKLTAADGESDNNFGESVGVSDDGTTALIGAEGDDDDTGSAYVFSRSEGAWSQQQKFTASDGESNDVFGQSVGLSDDGTTALISALDDNPNGENAGSAYVFSRSEGAWSQQQKLTPSDGNEFDDFGFSVGLSDDGTTALIGVSSDDNPNGENARLAYVFSRSEGAWNQQQKLTASDGESGDFFVNSVAMSDDGTTALIGASTADTPNGDFTGSAYVFSRSEGAWSQQQKLTPSDGNEFDDFGDSVSLSGNGTTALIGAEGNDRSAGSAYVFSRSEGAWSQQQEFMAADSNETYDFGESVGVSDDGTTALIGASTNTIAPVVVGEAYVFSKNGSTPPGGGGELDLSVQAGTAPPGGTYTLTYQITNTGSTTIGDGNDTDPFITTGPFTLNQDLDGPPGYTTEASIPDGGWNGKTWANWTIDPGETLEANLEVELPDDIDPGEYEFTIVASGTQGTLEEQREYDRASGVVTVTEPSFKFTRDAFQFRNWSGKEPDGATVDWDPNHDHIGTQKSLFVTGFVSSLKANILPPIPLTSVPDAVLREFAETAYDKFADGEFRDAHCFGMVFAAEQYYQSGVPDSIPAKATSASDIPQPTGEYHPVEMDIDKYHQSQGRDASIWWRGNYVLKYGNVDLDGQFSEIRDAIDNSGVAPVGLGGDGLHQVLAYDYDNDNSNKQLTVYDPNEPPDRLDANITGETITFENSRINYTAGFYDTAVYITPPQPDPVGAIVGGVKAASDIMVQAISEAVEGFISIFANSPVQIDVTAPDGTQLLHPDGPVNGTPPDEIVYLTGCSAGEYQITVEGTGSGSYTIESQGAVPNGGRINASQSGSISEGETQTLTATVPDQDGESGTVTPPDSDGFSLAEFDRDNDGEIGFDDLRYATREYNRENISFEQLRRVLRAYNTDQQV
jgi:hypothetical protein